MAANFVAKLAFGTNNTSYQREYQCCRNCVFRYGTGIELLRMLRIKHFCALGATCNLGATLRTRKRYTEICSFIFIDR